jgi:ABC-2 type transport system permease protein
MTWILLFVLVGLMAILYFLLFAVSRVNIPGAQEGMGDIQNLLGLPFAIPFAMSMLASFGALLAVILVASSVGNEYNWRTIRTALTASESRGRFLGAKLIVVVTLILIGMVAGVLTGFVMSMITTAIGGSGFDFSFLTGSYIWDQFVQFWRTLYIMLPYTFLGFMMAVVGRSAMPGIAVAIGVLFLETIITTFMSLAGGWVAQIPDYLISANVNAIRNLSQLPSNLTPGMGGGSTIQLPSVTHAFVALALYSVAFVVVAFYLFRKRDVTG